MVNEITMDKELKILLLEDMADDAGLIERILRKEKLLFTSKRVDTREDFTDALVQFRPDVVLSDHGLPQFNSIEAFQLCREQSNTPFILVTGTVSEEFAVTCLKMGVDDYILKSNLSRLPLAIIAALKKSEAEKNKLKAESELFAQNEELKLANYELVKANTELDNFVYSVSHNLRGPISSVLGLINLARSEGPEANAVLAPYFTMMEQSIKRLDETIREILDYSHNSRDAIELEEIDGVKMGQQTFEKLKYMHGAERIRFEVLCESDSTFMSDARRMSVIFSNLIANSIKYSDHTKADKFLRIHIAVGEKITIEFEDNGVGIPEKYFTRIFDMFYRVNERSDGAGLGLYIAKESVEKLNGQISVESQLGKGSKFRIEIPSEN